MAEEFYVEDDGVAVVEEAVVVDGALGHEAFCEDGMVMNDDGWMDDCEDAFDSAAAVVDEHPPETCPIQPRPLVSLNGEPLPIDENTPEDAEPWPLEAVLKENPSDRRYLGGDDYRSALCRGRQAYDDNPDMPFFDVENSGQQGILQEPRLYRVPEGQDVQGCAELVAFQPELYWRVEVPLAEFREHMIWSEQSQPSRTGIPSQERFCMGPEALHYLRRRFVERNGICELTFKRNVCCGPRPPARGAPWYRASGMCKDPRCGCVWHFVVHEMPPGPEYDDDTEEPVWIEFAAQHNRFLMVHELNDLRTRHLHRSGRKPGVGGRRPAGAAAAQSTSQRRQQMRGIPYFSDETYDAFIRVKTDRATDEDHKLVARLRRPNLDTLIAVACDYEDEALGTVDYRIVEKKTLRVVVRQSDANAVLEYYGAHLHKQFPEQIYGFGLRKTIWDRYCGIGELQIREFLELKGITSTRKKLADDVVDQEMDEAESEAIASLGTSAMAQLVDEAGPSASPLVEQAGFTVTPVATPVNAYQKRKRAPFKVENPITDRLYEKIARYLHGERVPLQDPDYDKVRLRAKRDSNGDTRIKAIWWTHGDGILKGGWRLVDVPTGKVIPRTSEVEHICRHYYEKLGHPIAKVLKEYAQDKYFGISRGACEQVCNQRTKTARAVVFPKTPETSSERPMQHVQIDIIEMTANGCGPKNYDFMLVVQCLFSKYHFARALTGRLNALIIRHLVDIFGSFGPPEAFRSYNNRELVAECMEEVSQVFHVPVESMGRWRFNKSVDAFGLRRACYAKSQQSFDDDEHWVETLPFVLFAHNQKPHASFRYRLSPFEVMFARQPWQGRRVPPWLDLDEQELADIDAEGGLEVEEAVTLIGQDGSVVQVEPNTPAPAEGTYWRRSLVCDQVQGFAEKQLETFKEVGGRTEEEKNMGTGVVFEPGDEVFVRNLQFDETGHFHDRGPRFFSGIVYEVDLSQELPYKVHVYDTAGQATEYNVSAFDITAVTTDLEKQRRLVRPEKKEHLCQCEDEKCRRTIGEKCRYRMSQGCCHARFDDCEYHMMDRKKRMLDEPKLPAIVNLIEPPVVAQPPPPPQMDRSSRLARFRKSRTPGQQRLLARGNRPSRKTELLQMAREKNATDDAASASADTTATETDLATDALALTDNANLLGELRSLRAEIAELKASTPFSRQALAKKSGKMFHWADNDDDLAPPLYSIQARQEAAAARRRSSARDISAVSPPPARDAPGADHAEIVQRSTHTAPTLASGARGLRVIRIGRRPADAGAPPSFQHILVNVERGGSDAAAVLPESSQEDEDEPIDSAELLPADDPEWRPTRADAAPARRRGRPPKAKQTTARGGGALKVPARTEDTTAEQRHAILQMERSVEAEQSRELLMAISSDGAHTSESGPTTRKRRKANADFH